MKTTLTNIFRLGIKELRSLWADKVLLILICWVFTGGSAVAGWFGWLHATSTAMGRTAMSFMMEPSRCR